VRAKRLLVRAAAMAALAFAACTIVLAQQKPKPGGTALPPVTVTAPSRGDPVEKSYRKMVQGMDYFERARAALAPDATLRFKLLPRKPGTDMDHVLLEVIGSTFDRLVDRGYALRTGDQLWLTQSGARQVDCASSALVSRIVVKLATSPTFEGRPDRDEVEAALERIAHQVLVQRDWHDEGAVPVTAAR